MKHVFVPKLVDASNLNAQCLNTRAFLKRWNLHSLYISCVHYGQPDGVISTNPGVKLRKLWRWRFWRLHMALTYARSYDGIFYPGFDIADIWGLRVNKWFRPKLPIVATMEGLAGNPGREAEYSAWAGHRVFCQNVNDRALARLDYVLEVADQVIAISPFLARMGSARYGNKFSVLPLGVDASLFYPPQQRDTSRITVVAAGSVAPHKGPELFLELARRHPEVMFKWFGEGESRHILLVEARRRKLGNLEFPGSVTPSQLAEQFRKAHIFVLPSKSEGVPKVTQEAAACGLPVILYGFYESPTVVHEKSGFVAWDEEDFSRRVGELISDAAMRLRMGSAGVQMAPGWDWDKVAPLWEEKVSDLIGAGRSIGH